MSGFVFTVKYDNYEYIKTHNVNLIMKNLKTNQKKIILLENDDLCEVASSLMFETDTMIVNTKFSGSQLSAFEHPITKQILIAAEEHDNVDLFAMRCSRRSIMNNSNSKTNHGHN